MSIEHATENVPGGAVTEDDINTAVNAVLILIGAIPPDRHGEVLERVSRALSEWGPSPVAVIEQREAHNEMGFMVRAVGAVIDEIDAYAPYGSDWNRLI